jgi:hypothetical protein
MTCKCRYCGNLLCYASEDVGRDVQCSRCSQTIRLPGKLQSLASIRRVRRKNLAGIAMELGGFGLMLFLFPWGLMAGIVVVYLGWRKSTILSCTQCAAQVAHKDVAACPNCRARFGPEE